jgi:hypothetical protein
MKSKRENGINTHRSCAEIKYMKQRYQNKKIERNKKYAIKDKGPHRKVIERPEKLWKTRKSFGRPNKSTLLILSQLFVFVNPLYCAKYRFCAIVCLEEDNRFNVSPQVVFSDRRHFTWASRTEILIQNRAFHTGQKTD